MRTSFKYYFILITFISLFITSCTSDSSSEVDDGGVSSGDYWPSALNNQWVLNQNGVESTMKIIAVQNINGETYYKFNQLAGQGESDFGTATIWLKKVNGNYSIKMDDFNIDYNGFTGVMTGYEYVFFKDNLDVNQTWEGSFSQKTTYNIDGVSVPPITTNIKFKGTILERDSSLLLNGVNYSNVIKFKMHQEGSISGQSGVVIDLIYWFAKDVGFLKMTSGTTTTQLVSYLIK